MSSRYNNDQEPLQNKEIPTTKHINKFLQNNQLINNNTSLQVEPSNFDDNDKVPLQIDQSNNNLKSTPEFEQIKFIHGDEEFLSLHVKQSKDSIKDTYIDGKINVSTIPEDLILIKENFIDNDNNNTVPDVIDIKNKNKYMNDNDNLESLQFHQITYVKNSYQVQKEISNNNKDIVETKNLNCSNNVLEIDNYHDNKFSLQSEQLIKNNCQSVLTVKESTDFSIMEKVSEIVDCKMNLDVEKRVKYNLQSSTNENNADKIAKNNNISKDEVIINSKTYDFILNTNKDVCTSLQNKQMYMNTFPDNSLQSQSMNNNESLHVEKTYDTIIINLTENDKLLEIDNSSYAKNISKSGQVFIRKLTNSPEIESTDNGVGDQTSLFNESNIEAKELSQTIPIENNKNSTYNVNSGVLINDEIINFSNEKFSEIIKNLEDRDVCLYEQIFFSNDDEEFIEVKQETTDDTNVSNKKSLQIQKISNNLDTSLPKKSLIVGNEINCSLINPTNISKSTNLVEEKSKFNIENTLPKIKSIVINTVNPVVTDPINLISNEDLLESNNFEKLIQKNKTSVPNDVKISLEKEKINSHNTVSQSLDIMDKNIASKESNIILKLQGMNWLKTRSTSDPVNMNHNPKPILKNLPKKDERNKEYIPIYENPNNRKCRSNSNISTVQNKNQNEIKVSDSSKQNNVQQQKSRPKNAWGDDSVKELFPNSVRNHETDEAEELSKVLAESICTAQRENEIRKMAQTSLKVYKKDDDFDSNWEKPHQNLPVNQSAEAGNSNSIDQSLGTGFVDKFGRVDGYTERRLFMGKGARRKEQEFLKAHTENKSRLQSNQGFLQFLPSIQKSTTETNSYLHHEIKKESNLTENEEGTEVNKNQHEIKTETVLFNKNRERSIHGRSEKFSPSEANLSMYERSSEEFNLHKPDLSMNRNHQKLIFNQKTSKDLNQACKEDALKYNQDLAPKMQESAARNLNINFPDRISEYNKNQQHINKYQNYADRYQENMNKNQEFFNREQNHPENKIYDNANKKQDNLNRNPNFPDRSQEIIVKHQDYSNKSSNYHDRNHEILKKNQESFHRNQYYPKNHEEFINASQHRFVKHSMDEGRDENHYMNSNLTFQSSQQICNYKSRSQMQEMNFSNAKFNQHSNSNFEENKIIADNRLDISGPLLSEENLLKMKRFNDYYSLKTSGPASDIMGLNEVQKNISTPRTYANLNTVCENSNCEPKPNVVMSFEGNQNVQRALGLTSNTCNSVRGIHQQMSKTDVPNADAADTAISATYLNTNIEPNVPFTQPIPCTNYDASMQQATTAMNVNAPPFNNISPNQGVNGQYSNGVEGTMPNLPFGFFPTSNNEIVEQQLRMNEISNSSQKLLSLHNTVCSLSKQLASAQANLLAAQVKFYQDAVSCSSNTQNQLGMPFQNQSLPSDFVSPKYTNVPSCQSPISNIQKPQSDAYELANNFSTMNVQDFVPETFQSNSSIEQRLNLQPMYIQQSNLYQQQSANFQQYDMNAQTANGILRRSIILLNNEERELRDNKNQFHTH